MNKRAVGRVSRTGVTRHRNPSSDYATLIRPTTTEEAAKIALTLPSPRGRGRHEMPPPLQLHNDPGFPIGNK